MIYNNRTFNFNPGSGSIESESSRKKRARREDLKGDNEIKWWGKSICLDAVGHVSLFLDFRSLNHFDHSYKAHRAVTDWAWRNLRQKTGFTTWSESQGKDKRLC